MGSNQSQSGRITAWICGDYLEVSEIRDRPSYGIPGGESTSSCCGGEGELVGDAGIRAAYRAQREVRRLCNTNRLYSLWTLTFAPHPVAGYNFEVIPVERTKDRDETYKTWKFFLRRLARFRGDSGVSKWVMVLERHNSVRTHPVKRDTYHVHVAAERGFDADVLARLWGHGFVTVRDCSQTTGGCTPQPMVNPGVYISKYISKDGAAENHARGTKRYSRSRSCAKPIKLGSEAFVNFAKTLTTEVLYDQAKIIPLRDGVEELVRYDTHYKLQSGINWQELISAFAAQNGDQNHERTV